MAARILIAEDNAINQKVLLLMLKRAGYQADVVWNGQEAVEACRAHEYELILMDCQMPELDGWEATRQIRKLNKPQPTIIAVTAHALTVNQEECRACGMDEFLSKPYQAEQLLTLVRNRLERSEE
jgi:CheY-like chemotaxis protein